MMSWSQQSKKSKTKAEDDGFSIEESTAPALDAKTLENAEATVEKQTPTSETKTNKDAFDKETRTKKGTKKAKTLLVSNDSQVMEVDGFEEDIDDERITARISKGDALHSFIKSRGTREPPAIFKEMSPRKLNNSNINDASMDDFKSPRKTGGSNVVATRPPSLRGAKLSSSLSSKSAASQMVNSSKDAVIAGGKTQNAKRNTNSGERTVSSSKAKISATNKNNSKTTILSSGGDRSSTNRNTASNESVNRNRAAGAIDRTSTNRNTRSATATTMQSKQLSTQTASYSSSLDKSSVLSNAWNLIRKNPQKSTVNTAENTPSKMTPAPSSDQQKLTEKERDDLLASDDDESNSD